MCNYSDYVYQTAYQRAYKEGLEIGLAEVLEETRAKYFALAQFPFVKYFDEIGTPVSEIAEIGNMSERTVKSMLGLD